MLMNENTANHHVSEIPETVESTSASGSRLLLDSNIWIKEVGLMSRRASTLRLFMHECDIRLCLPEVIQAETEYHLVERMLPHVKKARRAHEQLLPLFAKLQEWSIPSDDAVAKRAAKLARGIDLPVDYLELQPDTALRAARRCIFRRAPAERAERAFKDCVIWEEVLNVLDSHDLSFVTNDDGFYASEKSSANLHPSLEREAMDKRGNLAIVRGLEWLLKPFREEYEAPSVVVMAFVQLQATSLKLAAESMGFEAASIPQVSVQAFATETPGTVEVRFESVQPYADTGEPPRPTQGLRIRGRGLYSDREDKLRDVALDHERLIYTDFDGVQKAVPGSVIYLHPEPVVLGGPPHRVFDRLDPIDSM